MTECHNHIGSAMHNRLLFLSATISTIVRADIRTCTAPGSDSPPDDKTFKACDESSQIFGFDRPNTFGYLGIEEQRIDKYDQYIRSNIDNQQNKRDEEREAAHDMLPCRQPFQQMEIVGIARGQEADFPIRWNNPHESSCEINLWTGDMTQNCAIRKPFNCGGGFKNQLFKFTVPADTPGCDTPEDECFLQLYGHSVETRTYAICTRFFFNGGAATESKTPQESENSERKRSLRSLQTAGTVPFDYTQNNPTLDTYESAQGSTGSEASCVMKDSINYWDSFDSSHKDKDFSVYRGQQPKDVLPHVKAACDLRSYIGDGGLVRIDDDSIVGAERSLRDTRKKWKDIVDAAIENAEAYVIPRNEKKLAAATDGCYQGEIYLVVDPDKCDRSYTNTYVTNVNYEFILEKLGPLMEAEGLTQYSAELKDCPNGTPDDPIGQYEVDNDPSTTTPLSSLATQPMQAIQYCSDKRQNPKYAEDKSFETAVVPEEEGPAVEEEEEVKQEQEEDPSDEEEEKEKEEDEKKNENDQE